MGAGNITVTNITGTLTAGPQTGINAVGTLTALTVTNTVAANNVNTTNYANAKHVNAINGSLTTASIPAFNGTQTWNNSAVTFTGILENITDTASAANSLLIDLQVASASKFAVNKGGNVYFSGTVTGNGNGLSSIQGANVTGTVSAATTAGTVTTAAQPNITSVGTLTSLAVTGNITAGNVSATTFTGALSGAATSATTAGTVTTAAQPNITSVGTLTSVSVTGNANVGNLGTTTAIITTGNITTINSGLLQNGNSNVTLTSNANVAVYVAGNATARAVFTSTGANIVGTANITGNANVGNLGTAQVLSTANVTAPQLISNIATGTAPLVVTSTTQVANLNVASAGFATESGSVLRNTSSSTTAYPMFTTNSANGYLPTFFNTGISSNLANASITATTFVGALSGAATTAGSATTAGTVTTAAQPNITSTGTLTGLTVSGNITAQANINVTGYNIRSVATGIIALGINQGTATAITKEMNVVSTALLGNGIILPTAVAGMAITIINTSANALLVYPHSGGDINGAATNAAFSHSAGATLQYVAPNTTDWYTVGATYA